jgi:hypothetical protein
MSSVSARPETEGEKGAGNLVSSLKNHTLKRLTGDGELIQKDLERY